MAATSEEKQEDGGEAVMSPADAENGEVEIPYSIYSNKEKWLIVGMVGLAGFYRHAQMLRTW